MLLSRTLSPLIRSAHSRRFTPLTRLETDFTHAVIGGGVVGLAIARQLQERSSTVLLEKHHSVGTETSSRNSEVIHAGLYYGVDTLKTNLCIRGKEMMYDLCSKNNIPHRNTGKWIVAQNAEEFSALEKVHEHSKAVGVPTHFLSKKEAQDREPSVRAEAGVLESPTTGIVDSHALMQFLEGDFEDRGGTVALESPVTQIKPVHSGKAGWEVTITTPFGEKTTILVEVLINAAGLYGIPISNMVVPKSRRRTPYYAKGTYFSYSASSPKPSTLIYPAPIPGHGGLGTHLTLDMAGRVRFGPDVEWIDDPTDYRANGSRLEAALDDIEAYLPGIDRSAIGLDYTGIRPKLAGPDQGSVSSGQGFNDFWIKNEKGFAGFVNLMGIESPGLTSSLAIGEYVDSLVYV
ncbi:NAD dehydrogenase [Massarina eburnea CBS 473.64]|uniref:L-2-hydroxyglutarate dehydrogenase, mitochondrial n=1 Tax=Massarina eburnea CBS 473.64 TaxID=1395130 RepID=A0A6A6RZX5_9PLEO|nr:NAD dehydrogenase [Massarina eburnea CBS 473.64]